MHASGIETHSQTQEKVVTLSDSLSQARRMQQFRMTANNAPPTRKDLKELIMRALSVKSETMFTPVKKFGNNVYLCKEILKQCLHL